MLKVGFQAILVLLFIIAATLGTVSGVLFAYAGDLPEISALDNYRPHTITRLLSRDGEEIGEFAIEHRVVMGYDDMAPVLRQAIIATEDGGFERHFGVSVSRMIITAVKRRADRPAIRRQHDHPAALANAVPHRVHAGWRVRSARGCWASSARPRKSWSSIQIEKRYTKREILTMYANQINLGPGLYGVEAASRAYFDKPAKELTLEEAATIAAIIQTPARFSPFVNPDRTLARRNNTVLPRMVEEGFITEAHAREAAASPLVIVGQPVRGSLDCAVLRGGDPEEPRREVRRG